MKPTADIQLTAYALGEGTPTERAAVETRLRTDPAAQAAVDDVRAFAARLESDLQAEPDIALTDDQRRRIRQAADRPAGRLLRFPWLRLTGFAAVAAVVTLVFGGALWNAAKHLLENRFAKSRDISIACEMVEVDEQQLDELLAPAELPELVDLKPPEVDLDMAPPPEVQDFCAAPAARPVAELEIASDRISPIVM